MKGEANKILHPDAQNSFSIFLKSVTSSDGPPRLHQGRLLLTTNSSGLSPRKSLSFSWVTSKAKECRAMQALFYLAMIITA